MAVAVDAAANPDGMETETTREPVYALCAWSLRKSK
jgi:hypothetical protein